jgi:hypothetical protein
MRGIGLERPPRWGIAVVVGLIAGNVALFSFMASRPEPADTYVSRAVETQISLDSNVTVPPVPSTPATSAEPSILAVYGDGYAAGNVQGGQGASGWPALVAERTGAALQLHAASQAGYVSTSPNGEDYGALVSAGPVPGAAVTLLFGSRNDVDEDLAAVRAEAAAVVQAAQAAATDDTLIVIGPSWSSAAYPAELLSVRDAVRNAAQAADAQFVDPLTEGWFASPAGLIASDGISPNDAGHAYLAERIAPLVEAALSAPN